MLDVKIDHGEIHKMIISGGVADIAADFAMIYKTIYASLLSDNKQAAAVFADGMTKALPYAKELAEKDVAAGKVNAINMATPEGLQSFLNMLKKKAYADAEGFNDKED